MMKFSPPPCLLKEKQETKCFDIIYLYNTQNTDLFLENLLACIYKRLIDDNERTCYLVG